MGKKRSNAAVVGILCLSAMAGTAALANAGVDVLTPNVRVSVGNPAPPPPPLPRVAVIERERVIVHESGRHDRGKHKGWYKRHEKRHDRHGKW